MTSEQLRARVLTEWRGLPIFDRGQQDTAKPVAALLKSLLGELGLSDRLRQEEITKAWTEIVGEFLGHHSAPNRLQQGVLSVRVLQPTLRYEFDRVWKKDILAKLQARFGQKTVREVKFQIG
jgi:predicted nucleic acid-binding Zn ribbon protein